MGAIIRAWNRACRRSIGNLEAFRQRYWDFYKQLRAYQKAPTPERPAQLREQFDELFSTGTGYDALDQRILKPKADKNYLLMELEHPEIALHHL